MVQVGFVKPFPLKILEPHMNVLLYPLSLKLLSTHDFFLFELLIVVQLG